jgi:hypothetical protein
MNKQRSGGRFKKWNGASQNALQNSKKETAV